MVQEEEPQPVHPETEAAPAVEEAFGENKKTGPVKADRKSRREKKRQQKQAKQEMAEMQDDPSGAQPQEAQVKHTPQPTGNAAQPAPKKTKKKELSNDFLYHDMEEKVKLKTGTKVRINRKSENKGKIEIEYYSQDDLEKILGYFK